MLADPYFCEGSVVRHLGKLGFTSVYNRNEDFYAVVAAGRVPDHDVLVTNPPYSSDHMQRILRFCAASNRHVHPMMNILQQYIHHPTHPHSRCCGAA